MKLAELAQRLQCELRGDGTVEITGVNGIEDAKANEVTFVANKKYLSNPQIIANRQAWKDPAKREKIEQISLLLKGALDAEAKVGIKMNVPKEKLDVVVAIVESKLGRLTSPTVSPLYRSGWFAVETIISEEIVRDLIPELIKNGAEGIVEYPLNKIV